MTDNANHISRNYWFSPPAKGCHFTLIQLLFCPLRYLNTQMVAQPPLCLSVFISTAFSQTVSVAKHFWYNCFIGLLTSVTGGS